MTIRRSGWLAAGVLACVIAPAAAAAAAGALGPVEDAVQEAVAEQVEARVTAAVADQVSDQVTAQVSDTVSDQVANQAADAAADQVADSVAGSVSEQVSDGVGDRVSQSVADEVAETAGGQAQDAVGDAVSGRVLNETARRVLEEVERNVGEGAEFGRGVAEAATSGRLPEQAAGAADASASDPESFIVGVDPLGRAVERGVLVLLVPEEALEDVLGLGLDVLREQPLAGLGRVLVRVAVDPALGFAQVARQIRAAAPEAVVDHNHLYDASTASDALTATGGPVEVPTPTGAAVGPPLTLGVVDTALDTAHKALADVAVVSRDFITGDRPRPRGHGTAIASVIADTARVLGRQPHLYSANVFFERDDGVATATSEALVQAVAWMIEERLPVVNMSLTGPSNELLHLAVREARTAGVQVVAAVGNRGPVGPPLFPAAYDEVIGVTAVDGRGRIFSYANRGRQVTFAAPGVGVRVAQAGGGYAEDDGTSLAAAHAAVLIAAARTAGEGVDPAAVVDRLKSVARDLGEMGYDEVYGFGLIAPIAP